MKSLFLIFLIAGAAAFSESVSKPVSRTVTPNGDHKNDAFVYKCYNPRDLKVTGEIFDLTGRKVSVMAITDQNRIDYYYILTWAPPVRAKGGVYIYQITQGETNYRGTFAIIR